MIGDIFLTWIRRYQPLQIYKGEINKPLQRIRCGRNIIKVIIVKLFYKLHRISAIIRICIK